MALGVALIVVGWNAQNVPLIAEGVKTVQYGIGVTEESE